MRKIYSIQELSYVINNRRVIKDVTCDIEEGVTMIKGPNGAGKTTFLKLLFGMIQPTTGNIIRYFDESNINISFVFQEPIFLNRSVGSNLEHALTCYNGRYSHRYKYLINEILSEFNIIKLFY